MKTRNLIAIFALLCLFTNSYVVFGQDKDNPIADQIRKQLGAPEQKKIDEAKKQKQTGDAMLAETDKVEAEMNSQLEKASTAKKGDAKKFNKKAEELQKKLIKNRLKAFETLAKANLTKYTVYSDNFKKIKAKANKSSISEGEELEKQAKKHFDEAVAKHTRAKKEKDELKMIKILSDANEMELLAIEEQEIAYDMYLNWAAMEEDFQKKQEQSNNTPTKSTASSSSNSNSNATQNEEPQKNNTQITEEYITTSESEENNTQSEVTTTTSSKQESQNNNTNANTNSNSNSNANSNNSQNTITTNSNQTIAKDAFMTQGIIFKIQIIATRKQLAPEKIKKIYNTDQLIISDRNNDDGLYRYSVGTFNTYAEAQQFKASTNVRGAFIVAYKDGKRISISEAIKLTQGK